MDQQMHFEDDQDEVLAEFDVCLAGKLKNNIHLLQYPLRPNYRQYGDQGNIFKMEVGLTLQSQLPTSAGQNAKQREVQSAQFDENFKLHYKLNKDSQNYDSNAVDHRISSHCLESQRVDYDSQEVYPNYCIGVLKEGKFLLTPLTSFHQMRPSFEHVDKERQMRLINSAQIQAEKRAAQAKLQRAGMEQPGQQNIINESNKEWKEVRYHSLNSHESEREFEKLFQFGKSAVQTQEQEEMQINGDNKGNNWQIIPKQEFQDLLAPFDNTEDFSTSSLQKNKGPNLTIEFLALLPFQQMLETILRKAGIIDFERLVRILTNACKLSKQQMLSHHDLLNLLLTKYCYLTQDTYMLILKSDFKYDFATQKRKVALRDYLIQSLETNKQISLSQLTNDLQTRFSEFRESVNELCILQNEILTFKTYESKYIADNMAIVASGNPGLLKAVKDSWLKLASDLKRYREANFYKDIAQIQAVPQIQSKQEMQNKQQLKNLVEQIYLHFSTRKISNYPHLINHLNENKVQLNSEQLLEIALQEHTIAMGDRLLIRQVQDENEQVIRDILLQLFSQKDQYKKADLKRQVNEKLQGTLDLSDKELTKLIGYYTKSQGQNLVLQQP
eukprot:403375132